MPAKILISGDSWGCGEWGSLNGKYQLLHPGLEFYLTEAGHSVTNLSVGGSSNLHSILRLTKELYFNQYDYVFWIQSVPLRNIRPYENFETRYKSYNDLLVENDRILEQDYMKLNNLKQVIFCLGGCSLLNLKLLAKFKNLVPLVPSISKLILDDYDQPELWIDEWRSKISNQFDLETLNMFTNIDKKIDQLTQNNIYRQYFYPDGLHPNREGHRVLFEFINKELKLNLN